MANHLDPFRPEYGSSHPFQDPFMIYNDPPYPGSSYNGTSSSYFPENHDFHSGPQQYYNFYPPYEDGSHCHNAPYQNEENDSEDNEDNAEDESVIINSLEEALQEFTLQLPRLAVIGAPSVLPPKGEGLCRLPNLGNTCYVNVVLQCLYHTPGLPAVLDHVCKELGDTDKGRKSVAHTLNFLMTRMDNVKKLKKGVLAYFKGVCGLRDERFASEEQQEAHDLLNNLFLWLHQDLASKKDLDCACTKNSVKKHSAATTATSSSNDNKRTLYSDSQSTSSYYQQQKQEKRPSHQPSQQYSSQYQLPVSQNYPVSCYYHHHSQPQNSYGSGSSQQPHCSYGSHHSHLSNTHHYLNQQLHDENHTLLPDYKNQNNHYQISTKKHQAPKNRGKSSSAQLKAQEGKVCDRCGVTYQRRSFISDMFEGIMQQDIICPERGVIISTILERFTSISLPVRGATEITLEEAVAQFFRRCMLMWNCEYCGSSHLCHQQNHIICAPPILVMHISRYTDRRNPRKQSVVFPIEGLTLHNHIKSTNDRVQRYNLYGVCNHHGTTQQGHYSASCRTSRNHHKLGSWYDFDDVEVSKVTHFRRPREAHILFYSTSS